MLHLREEIASRSIRSIQRTHTDDRYDDEEAQIAAQSPRTESSPRVTFSTPTADAPASDDSSQTRSATDDDTDAEAVERSARQFCCNTTTSQPETNVSFAPQASSSNLTRSATKTPSQTLEAVYSTGQYKAALRLDILSVQSFMAGIYIAMAGQIFLSVGGGVLGAGLFSAGLLGVVLTSGELFTGDALVFVAALLGGRVKASSVARNWTVSWCVNFVGCLAWAFVIGYASDALQDLGKAEYAVAVAEKKAGQTFLGTFLKGIAANFMVCVGVWQATCAEEVSGKVLALWFPITGFVASGFDHCIANQFFFPLGMFLGADVTVGNMFLKLLAATMGNIVGGGFFVGAVYWYVFDSMQSVQQLKSRIRTGLRTSLALRSSLGLSRK
mmetsp:Transcript_21271/g.43605  ORF Transcript_21271/g.43605 Transcript_21271/m.43605 type:complete len:385 (+) Transcript_21271:155-1309(+)